MSTHDSTGPKGVGRGLQESTVTELGKPVKTKLHSRQVQAMLRTKQLQSRSRWI